MIDEHPSCGATRPLQSGSSPWPAWSSSAAATICSSTALPRSLASSLPADCSPWPGTLGDMYPTATCSFLASPLCGGHRPGPCPGTRAGSLSRPRCQPADSALDRRRYLQTLLIAASCTCNAGCLHDVGAYVAVDMAAVWHLCRPVSRLLCPRRRPHAFKKASEYIARPSSCWCSSCCAASASISPRVYSLISWTIVAIVLSR